MKKLTGSFPAKAAAVFLFAVSSVIAALSCIVCAAAVEYDFYAVPSGYDFSGGLKFLVEENFISSGYYSSILMRVRPKLILEFVFGARYAAIVLAVLGLAAAVASFVFLMCAAGRRNGADGICLSPVDRVPLDVLAAVYGLVAAFFLLSGRPHYNGDWYMFIFLSMALLASLLLALHLLYTFAARVKAGGWWRCTVIYMMLLLVGRALRAVLGFLKRLFSAISTVWRVSAVSAAFFILLFSVCAGHIYHNSLIWFIILELLGFSVSVLGAFQIRALGRASEELARGNSDYKIDTSHMYLDFKRQGENLNSIGDGISAAVEQRIRSERLKTELITNVSHGIKTPLTSIINYVDLLQKEPPRETALEYLDVLARQSERLRRLTTDLVEASKASTGNLPVKLEPISAEELINQAMAEYSEKFTACSLEPVITAPASAVRLLADGRHLWRVLDNLLNNVVKYAQAGTRVYIGVLASDGEAVISVKNISRERLNVTAEELMERFVRGDSSRHTEGSGLGLSIARSLTELMGGSFGLTTDGDLFKAEIRLKTI